MATRIAIHGADGRLGQLILDPPDDGVECAGGDVTRECSDCPEDHACSPGAEDWPAAATRQQPKRAPRRTKRGGMDGGLTLYGSHAIARYFARASGGAVEALVV